MILDKKQILGLEAATKPLIKFMAENYHPHTKIIIDCASAELVEGVASIRTVEFVKD